MPLYQVYTLFQKWGPITMLLRKLLIPSFILSSVRRISLKLYNWFKLQFDLNCFCSDRILISHTYTHTPEKRSTVDHKHFNVRHLILFEKYFKLFGKPSTRLAFLICLQTSFSTRNAFFDLMHLKFDKPTTRAPFFYILQQ